MTELVKRQLDLLRSREYRNARVDVKRDVAYAVPEQLSPIMQSADRFCAALAEQEPLFHGEDLFGFNRYTKELCTPMPVGAHFGNLTVDYPTVLAGGLGGILRSIDEKYATADEIAREFYDSVRTCFAACERNVNAYREAAKVRGNDRLAKALEQVPMKGARDYYEALITVRFMHYILRINRTMHIGLGRVDQYMKPYFDASVKNGVTEIELLELTELFFIAMNLDTDLYEGVQQGDNGQSMVLGGIDKEGRDMFRALSEVCLAASQELCLIDPKINLRVNRNTPLSLYERGTQLTKQGLGFPQYCNDDVIIPAMLAWGYDEEDAYNYSIAACWEVLPSYNGADYPNVVTMNFPLVAERAIYRALPEAKNFSALQSAFVEELGAEFAVLQKEKGRYAPAALLSAFIRPCIERGRDIFAGGAKYYNYGVHGAGIANAADALYAVKRAVFEEKSVAAQEILDAMRADFVGHEALRAKLLAYPKMGCNEDAVDEVGCFIMDAFCCCLKGKRNNRGGIYRPGTGSAMEYLWSAARVGALPDGKRAQQPYPSSFSPSLTARTDGPLSAIQSFTKFDMKRIANGGPFTMEIHDTVFRNEEGERKVAMLVKSFIDLGGHQMQLNAVNRERLLDAQKHPENYPNLIVRVWGWSGYFNELDVNFQNHIISRCEFTV
ncbi:MAG: pyruvate formate-lyase [Clostridia bacterium]|nr:pyruvate formate-lyase [Clostridia bacterium]